VSFPTLDILFATGGWVGAVGTISAYALVSTSRLAPTSRAFQGTNAVGATLLALSAASAGSWPSTFVNVLWAVIGLQAFLVATWLRRSGLRVAVVPAPASAAHPSGGVGSAGTAEVEPPATLELCGVGAATTSH